MLNIDNYSLPDWLAKRSFEWCTHHKPPPRVPLASFGFQKPLANSGGNPRRVALRRSEFWRKNEFRNLAVSPEQNPNFFPKQSERRLICAPRPLPAVAGKNQKFSFLNFRFSAGGVGEPTKNGKEIFGFASPLAVSSYIVIYHIIVKQHNKLLY